VRLPLGIAIVSFSFAIIPVLVGYLLRAWHSRRWRRAHAAAHFTTGEERLQQLTLRPPRSRWFWLFPAHTIAGGAGGIAAALLLSPLLAPLSLAGASLLHFDNLHEFLTQPLCEEIGKAAPLLLIYRTRWFRDTLDGMILGLAAGLGFAAFENLLYFVVAYDRGGLPAWTTSVSERVLFSTALHGLASSFVGAYFGAAKQNPSAAIRRLALVAGLCAAVALHASWNGLITSAHEQASSALALGALALLAAGASAFFVLFRRAIRPDTLADTLTTSDHQIARM
jgi:RsiW-degrading membrane proteinase PrsW (M82 family)